MGKWLPLSGFYDDFDDDDDDEDDDDDNFGAKDSRINKHWKLDRLSVE